MMFGKSAGNGNSPRSKRGRRRMARGRPALGGARLGRTLASRSLRIESLEQRSLLSAVAPIPTLVDPAQSPEVMSAIRYASVLSNFTATQLSQVHEWVLGYQNGYSPAQMAGQIGAASLGATGLIQNTGILSFPSNVDAAQAQSELEGLQGYSYAFPLVPVNVVPYSFAVPPNDPLFSHEWQLNNTGVPQGVKGADANVEPVWKQGDTGQGVVIGIVDTGVYVAHPDLNANYKPKLSYNFLENNPNPTPPAPIGTTENNHGTEVAGIAAAVGNNGIGVSGAAPNASFAAIRLIGGSVSPQTFAQAVVYNDQQIQIYNNSWGPSATNVGQLGAAGPLTLAAYQDAATNGRGGLGSILVFAAGNGGQDQSNVNYDAFANSRFAIAVAAIDDSGKQAVYSNPGAALLISGYSGNTYLGAPNERGVPTTNVIDNNSTTPSTLQASYVTDNANGFNGTSAAAPLVSGVIALMLEANPKLSYRDVQMILAESASKNDPTDPGWVGNSASWTTDGVNYTPFHVNYKYGFGAIDAAAAVNLARTWTPLLPEQRIASNVVPVNQSVPVGSGGVSSSVTLSGLNLHAEHVEVVLDATAANRGDLQVTLTSPNGTQSVMALERTTDPNPNYTNWVFSSTRDWGENVSGTWTIQVSDLNSASAGATFTDWQLNVYGTAHYAPVAQDTSVNTRENQSVGGINLLANTYDVETGTVFGGAVVPSSLAITQPAHGTASIDPNTGLVTYTPNKNFFGTDTFTYTVLDNFGNISRSAVVTVNVQFIDQPPQAVNDTAVVSPGHSLQIQVLANDVPGNSAINPASVTIVSPPTLGTATVNTAGVVTYTPGANFVNGDSFTYDVKDVTGVVSNVATVTLIRNYPAPTAANDAETQAKNQTVSINVLANDTDPNPAGLNPASVTIVVGPAFGNAVVNPSTGAISYTPKPNFFGTDTLTYTVADRSTGQVSNVALVKITVLNVGPPLALDHEFVLVPNVGVVRGISLLNNPTNSGTLTPVLVRPTSLGAVTLGADGSITYQQGPNFHGIDTFTYLVNDGSINSNVATIRLVTSHFQFVEKLYNDVLHRSGSDAEILYWSEQIDAGVSRQSVALAIVNTPEARSFVINGIYEQLLRRPVDLGGLLYWQGELQAGLTPEEISAAIVSSGEYASLHGGTDAGFVAGLYADLLGRAAAPADMGYWTSVLAGGTSRFSVASTFMGTTEYRTRLVNSYFLQYLGRPADASISNPVGFFQQSFQDGYGDAFAQSVILASSEFYMAI
ncbi:MAG TPA: Ig-like domain-containing protein [Pirellulales bacterium]|nr:Ig-like domain-containing protein [Pirellulales bacterium]